jgi:hypothetical protein
MTSESNTSCGICRCIAKSTPNHKGLRRVSCRIGSPVILQLPTCDRAPLGAASGEAQTSIKQKPRRWAGASFVASYAIKLPLQPSLLARLPPRVSGDEQDNRLLQRLWVVAVLILQQPLVNEGVDRRWGSRFWRRACVRTRSRAEWVVDLPANTLAAGVGSYPALSTVDSAVSWFAQTRLAGRLRVTNVGRLPSPPQLPRCPRVTCVRPRL